MPSSTAIAVTSIQQCLLATLIMEGTSHEPNYRYSASKLMDKGILVGVDGASSLSLKAVSLEISSNEVGVFVISAKAPFIERREEVVVFHDLLQLQYEGISTMRMFNMCTVNVNLLIFQINKKFFNKVMRCVFVCICVCVFVSIMFSYSCIS